ncbi:LOW QUALITY PROTEIN: 5-hydroxytryptamine receptor 3C-like [Urocitellus parryii]
MSLHSAILAGSMQVTSICSLDIFYFPFDQQNCTLTFVLSHKQTAPEITEGAKLYDQIVFYVAIRCRPRLYVTNLLVPSGFLMAIDALSFYLPAKNQNRAPFKMTLLLGYKVFLLGQFSIISLPSEVYFALCLSLMVASLLETIFITYLLHLTSTQPPPMPGWLHSLLRHCTSPRRCCPPGAQKEKKGLDLRPTHLPGEPCTSHRGEGAKRLGGEGVRYQGGGANWVPRISKSPAETGGPEAALGETGWNSAIYLMDTLLFHLYLLFMASSLVTVIALWNT